MKHAIVASLFVLSVWAESSPAPQMHTTLESRESGSEVRPTVEHVEIALTPRRVPRDFRIKSFLPEM